MDNTWITHGGSQRERFEQEGITGCIRREKQDG